MSTLDLVPLPASPGSDDASLVFDDASSSDDIPSPSEPSVHVSLQPPRASSSSCDAVKGIASVGLAVNSPPAFFVGTPFAAGPAAHFEYPFPAVPSRPSLSNTSSLSSVSSALLGPPSPSTRAKFYPRPLSRLSSDAQPTRRRFSGGNAPPPIRVPPRLRTDSGNSVISNAVDDPTVTVKPSPSSSTPIPRSAPILNPKPDPSTQLTPRPMSPLSRGAQATPLLRLRNRSGSLGVLPIQLPPPAISSIRTIVQLNTLDEPISPAMFVGAMASPGFGVPKGSTAAGLSPAMRSTPTTGPSITREVRAASERRRASIPFLFTFGEGEPGNKREGRDGMGESACLTSSFLGATDKAARDDEGEV